MTTILTISCRSASDKPPTLTITSGSGDSPTPPETHSTHSETTNPTTYIEKLKKNWAKGPCLQFLNSHISGYATASLEGSSWNQEYLNTVINKMSVSEDPPAETPDSSESNAAPKTLTPVEAEQKHNKFQAMYKAIWVWLEYRTTTNCKVGRSTNPENDTWTHLAHLSGISKKKPKALQLHQRWSKDHFNNIVQEEFEKRCAMQGISGKAMMNFRDQVTREYFLGLAVNEQCQYVDLAKNEGKEAAGAWTKALNSPPSTALADQQAAINRFSSFAGPLLASMHELLGMHVTLLIGGPELCKNGQITVLSMHEGGDKSTVPCNWQVHDKTKFKVITKLFKDYLLTCYTEEECDAQKLLDAVNPPLISFDELESDQAAVLDPSPTTPKKGNPGKPELRKTQPNKKRVKGKKATDSHPISGVGSAEHQESTCPPISPSPSPLTLEHEDASFRFSLDKHRSASPPDQTAELDVQNHMITPPSPPNMNNFRPPQAPNETANSLQPPADKELPDSSPSFGDPQASVSLDISPEWFRTAYGYLNAIVLPEKFKGLLATFFRLERSSGFASDKGAAYALSSKGRLDVIHWWISCTHNGCPPICDLDKFSGQFWAWWCALQPTWQDLTVPIHGYALVKLHNISGDWTTLDKPGLNGFYSILAAISWWGAELSDQASNWQLALWDAVVDDVHWTMEQIIKSQHSPESHGQKCGASNSENCPTKQTQR
ncbi:hypothetical protein BDN67DRAFT_985248 [Paxillus ammoniavirescens]|nr:hypothetical protein BDN67DRAFT_985248 [Paxillus ammoniavirescens]